MEIFNWINKPLAEIKKSLLFGKYFETNSIDDWTCSYSIMNKILGIEIVLRGDLTVEAVHLYSESQKDVKRFKDPLPLGLKFTLTRGEVRELLGQPSETGGGGYSLIYGVAPIWDKYGNHDFRMHIEYSKELDSINSITLL